MQQSISTHINKRSRPGDSFSLYPLAILGAVLIRRNARYWMLFFVWVLLESSLFAGNPIQTGDTLSFWSVSYIDWPPLWGTPQRLVHASCKKVGQHCYVFVENTATQPAPQEIDTLVSKFDQNFYPRLTPKYGPVPDVFDQDPRVFILVLNESNWAGYFDPGQQMPDSMLQTHWGSHSNQREMIYVSASYFFYAGPIVAHEFGHLLHWGRDHSPEPINQPQIYWEEAWIDEQFSTFAELYLDEDINQLNLMYQAAYFATDPDKALIYFSDYDQVKLFMLFMFEHYGGWNYISSLIQNPLNGIAGVDSTLNYLGYTSRFDDVFEQFCVANYLDDTLFSGGAYGYLHYNFPSCLESYSFQNLPPAQVVDSVNTYSVKYLSFQADHPLPAQIHFRGESGRKFRLNLVAMKTATHSIVSVQSYTPNSQNEAVLIADSLGLAYDRLLLLVMAIDPSVPEHEKLSFQLSCQPLPVPELMGSTELSLTPNPGKEVLNIQIPEQDPVITEVDIIDMLGRIVPRTTWVSHGRSMDISGLPSGQYFICLRTMKKTYRAGFVKI